MTFYHIIFGFLLLAAFREFLRSLNDQNLAQIWESLTLMLLIFSDVIYTSHVIEEKKKPYTVVLKFIDLGSFILLSLAVFALDTSEHNLFHIPAGQHLQKQNWIAIFWFLIVLYWLLLIFWNHSGQMYAGLPNNNRWIPRVQPGLLVPFLVMFAVAALWPASAFAYGCRIVIAILAALYFVFYKSHVLDKMPRQGES